MGNTKFCNSQYYGIAYDISKLI